MKAAYVNENGEVPLVDIGQVDHPLDIQDKAFDLIDEFKKEKGHRALTAIILGKGNGDNNFKVIDNGTNLTVYDYIVDRTPENENLTDEQLDYIREEVDKLRDNNQFIVQFNPCVNGQHIACTISKFGVTVRGDF